MAERTTSAVSSPPTPSDASRAAPWTVSRMRDFLANLPMGCAIEHRRYEDDGTWSACPARATLIYRNYAPSKRTLGGKFDVDAGWWAGEESIASLRRCDALIDASRVNALCVYSPRCASMRSDVTAAAQSGSGETLESHDLYQACRKTALVNADAALVIGWIGVEGEVVTSAEVRRAAIVADGDEATTTTTPPPVITLQTSSLSRASKTPSLNPYGDADLSKIVPMLPNLDSETAASVLNAVLSLRATIVKGRSPTATIVDQQQQHQQQKQYHHQDLKVYLVRDTDAMTGGKAYARESLLIAEYKALTSDDVSLLFDEVLPTAASGAVHSARLYVCKATAAEMAVQYGDAPNRAQAVLDAVQARAVRTMTDALRASLIAATARVIV